MSSQSCVEAVQGLDAKTRNETFVGRSEREVCEREGCNSDISEVGGVDSSRSPGDGARLLGHLSASHGSGSY